MTEALTPEQKAAADEAARIAKAEKAAAREAEKQAKAAAKAAEKAAKDAEKQAAKDAKAAVKAAKEAEREAAKAAREAAKEAKANKAAQLIAERQAKAEAKAAAKAAREANRQPMQNGIRRPGPDGLCGRVWTLADQMSTAQGSPVAIATLLPVAESQGLVPGNVRTEYARWRKFNGLTGRIVAPVAA